MSSKRKRSSNVSIDEDDVPLVFIKEECDDPNSYKSLCVPNNQPCEFCCQVSENRYTSIIHNVRHIIIPLIKLRSHQCEVCHYHFTSEKDLLEHKGRKHSLSELLTHTDLVRNSFNNPKDNLFQSDLISIVKQENIDSIQIDPEPKTDHKYEEIYNLSDNFSLKNRLLFEEDITSTNCHRLLTDLTTDCKVNVEWFPPIWEVEHSKSVHYSELIKPGVFRCKICRKTFPTKYEAITHEAKHIYFRNSEITLCIICNQYILGNIVKLKKHQLQSHSANSQTTDTKPLKKYFGGKDKKNGVNESYFTNKTSVKFCNNCFAFCKNNSIRSYECVKELSEIGERHRCYKCGFKFFVVKLVNIETRCRYSNICVRGRRKKILSNEDRLKNIAQRLKKMRRTYICVLLLLTRW